MGTLIMFGFLVFTVAMIYAVVGYLDPQARKRNGNAADQGGQPGNL